MSKLGVTLIPQNTALYLEEFVLPSTLFETFLKTWEEGE